MKKWKIKNCRKTNSQEKEWKEEGESEKKIKNKRSKMKGRDERK